MENCKKCGKDRIIVNKTYKLCDDCNCIRLHGVNRFELQVRKAKEATKKKGGNLDKLKRDERFYKHIHETHPNWCNECGKPLNDKFRENGKIINRFQYSHIYSKGAYPEYRWHKLNMEKLCLKCHHKWEFGDKKGMKIYQKNEDLIVELRETKNDLNYYVE